MAKTVFGAILGGVLGGACAFALSRVLPPSPNAVGGGQSNSAPSGARPLADKLIAQLKAGNEAEFITAMRTTAPELTDEEYTNKMNKLLVEPRAVLVKSLGKRTDFEFLREYTLGPNLARLAYAERFTRGCVVWVMDFYNSPEGWAPHGLQYLTVERAFELLQ